MDVGNQIALSNETWSFADALDNFDEHILRSIPHCQEQRQYIAEISRFFLYAEARVYELGVSTGELAKAVLQRSPERQFQYIGLDIEPQMVEIAKKKLATDARFTAQLCNTVDYPFAKASLIISYYTLQFIPLEARLKLIKQLYQALVPGGALIIYEKTSGENAQMQEILTQLYFDFKAQQGLSAESILNKAIALRGVSMPCSLEKNREMLKAAGFESVEIIYRAYAFVGYLALKS